MMSMRAMWLEDELEKAIDRFAKLRGTLEKLVPMIDMDPDNDVWIYGPMDDEGWREDDDIDAREQIESVRATLLEMVDATHKIDGLLTAKTYLNS